VTYSTSPQSDPDWPWKPIAPADLYLLRGETIKSSRPYFQGDIFRGIRLPNLPDEMPTATATIGFDEGLVMLMPHPCSCYAGDSLRSSLSVSPIRCSGSVTGGDWRTQWKFPVPGVSNEVDGWVDLSTTHTVPASWLASSRRAASLTLLGVSWIHKRLLKYMTRLNWSVDNLTAQLKRQWDDIALWEVWSEVHGTQLGYEAWKKQTITVPSLGEVIPDAVIPGRTQHLIAFLRGEEPDE
jgi:hypothetical protein